MKKEIVEDYDATDKNSIAFKIAPQEEVLRIEANGVVKWNSPKGEIIIEDKKLLAVAFMAIVHKLTNKEYDLSLLDEETAKDYQEFLDSAE